MGRRAPGSMRKPSDEAKAAFSKLVPDEPAVTLKPMFGQLSAFVNGNMFCGIFGDELMVRLPDAEIAAVKKQGGRDFEPMAGHKMGGYVVVPGDWRGNTPPPPAALQTPPAPPPANTANTGPRTTTPKDRTEKNEGREGRGASPFRPGGSAAA